MIDILDIQLKSKFNSVGVKPLTGSIGSYIEATIDFIVHWEAQNFDCTLYGNQIVSNDGTNFITQGFKVGNTIELVFDEIVSSGSSSNEGSYLITGISSYIIYVSSTDSTSGPIIFDTEIGVTYSVYGTTPITAIDYYFGLVENSAGATYTSLIDGETQQFRATDLDAGSLGTETLTPQTLNKSWLTGSTTEQALNEIEEAGIGTSGSSTGYEQRFIITHVFHISPAILNGWEDSSEDLDQSLISWFAGSNSLKFIPKIVAGFVTSGTDHTTDTGNLSTFLMSGDVGFYDESRNGGAATYTKQSLIYSNSGDELAKNVATTATIVIKNELGNFTSDHRFDVYVFQLPETNAEVSNNINDVWTNFEVSNVLLTPAAGPVAHNLITVATATISTDEATITFTYTAPSNERKYIIFVDCGDTAIPSTSDSEHMSVLVDYNEFKSYIDTTNIIVFDNVLINEHSTDDITKASTDFKGWVEDGLLIRPAKDQTSKFSLKKVVSTDWTCTLNSVSVNISVEHATDSSRNFVLENLSLSNPENTTRGYVLETGDPKNYLKFNELPADATYRYYALEYATKIQWMEWLTLTTDPDFTTSNANWSIYDLPPSWQIYINVVITANLVNGDETETYERTHKTELNVKNYEQFNNCEIDGTITTFLTSSGANLGGVLAKTANTTVIGSFYGYELFPCIYDEITSGSHESDECEYEEILSGSGSYSSGEGNLSECPDYYAILEIDQPNGGPLTIDPIFTDRETSSSTKWLGEISVNKAKLIAYPYANPPRIDVIATLDYTLLNTTLPYYKLTAKLGKAAQTICAISIMQSFSSFVTSFVSPAFAGYTLLELLVFNVGFELSCHSACSISGTTLTFNPAIIRIVKVCCSKNAENATTNGGGAVLFGSLVGESINNFIGFVANSGTEITTLGTTVFISGTGTLSGLPAIKNVKLSHHEAFIVDSVSAVSTYTNTLLSGKTLQEIMFFVNGREYTVIGGYLTGSTFNFPSPVTGILKVCLVSQ